VRTDCCVEVMESLRIVEELSLNFDESRIEITGCLSWNVHQDGGIFEENEQKA